MFAQTSDQNHTRKLGSWNRLSVTLEIESFNYQLDHKSDQIDTRQMTVQFHILSKYILTIQILAP